jgi:hypothetical protein
MSWSAFPAKEEAFTNVSVIHAQDLLILFRFPQGCSVSGLRPCSLRNGNGSRIWWMWNSSIVVLSRGLARQIR